MSTEMTWWGPSLSLIVQFLPSVKKLERPEQGHRKLAEVWDISTQSCDDAYSPVLGLENQSDMVYDIWERYWDTYSMIIDYNENYPDQDVIIV